MIDHPPAAEVDDAPPHPIVGVGASAGGLEALERFFRAVSPLSNAAFVVIQHLDPHHESLLVELLGRATKMAVLEARDGLTAEAGHVYVIPPRRDLSILRGILRLHEPVCTPGQRLPIDRFLRALAVDRRERAVGVILSGMGSDGTAGLRAIKEAGGLTLVQAVTDARFDGMPQSAIEADVADIVATADELPARIVACMDQRPVASAAEPESEAFWSGVTGIVEHLLARTGHDFSLYKSASLRRRIARRMGIHHMETSEDYLRLLRDNGVEVDLLFKELLIGVTRFFRDPEAWEPLQAEVLPTLLAGRPHGSTLRAWIPGCSTGEEAYSLAIVLQELLARGERALRFQIFATDLDGDAIRRARRALFPRSISADVSAERLARFFVREGNNYRLRKEIRDQVIFAEQNVTMDPPFTKLDLVSCRNLLIYLEPELQGRLLSLFHYSLNPGGLLFLGSAEGVGGATSLFTPLRIHAKIYQRSADPPRRESMLPLNPIATSAHLRSTRPTPSLEAEADKLLRRRFAPAAAVVSETGDVLYCNGDIGRYLEPAAGRANWNVLAMAREGLLQPISRAIGRARREHAAVSIPGATLTTDVGPIEVLVTAEALDEPGPLQGTLMLAFTEGPSAPPGRRVDATEDALPDEATRACEECDALRRELQHLREDMSSSQEDMMSTNEELQSTNEELTTSREEMESMNEELQTVNCELQAKVDELSRASDDMRNLLDSTDIATLFLDDEIRVRRFTTQATTLIRLIPSDVGRPITDLTSSLDYPELPAHALEVLQALTSREREAISSDGRWFRVRIMPYRTVEDQIAGVVITFTEITAAKLLEAELRLAYAKIAARVPTAPNDAEGPRGA